MDFLNKMFELYSIKSNAVFGYFLWILLAIDNQFCLAPL